MKFLIVIATLVVSCIAAPNPPNTSNDRPSPINPSVLSDSRPADKTTLITDPKEVDKHKQETSKPFSPTVLPVEVHHHLIKRDNKPGHDSHPVIKPKAPEPPKQSLPPQSPKKSDLKTQHSPVTKLPVAKRNRRNVQPTQQKADAATIPLQRPQTLPAVIHNDAPNNQHPKTLAAHHGSNIPGTGFQKPQTLPAIIHEGGVNSHPKETTLKGQQHKRDIPAPLVAKHKPLEVSASEHTNEAEKKDKKEELVTPHNDNVQVEDLSEHKPVAKHTSSSPSHSHEFHPQRDHIEKKHSNSEEQKPAILGDILQKPNINKDDTESTNDHPVIRPKPVPVSELFSRPHDN